MEWECAFLYNLHFLVGGPWKSDVVLEKSLKDSCNFLHEPWKKEDREVEAEKNHFFIIIFYDGNKIFNIYLFMLQSGIFRINRTGVGNLSETVALPYLLGMVL